MKKVFLALLLSLSCLSAEQVTFTPPSGWRHADSQSLPSHVKLLLVGKGTKAMPPSLNLGYEEFSGNLKDYLEIVRKINASHGDAWRDLGSIETRAGTASLSQVEMPTVWGTLREMHLIYLHKGIVYILTAAALKEEFASFYPLFFEAFRSFQITQ